MSEDPPPADPPAPPIEAAYQALAAALAAALTEAGFLAAPEALEIDPPSPIAVAGDETSLVVAAALVQLRTAPVRTLLGGSASRYVVERQARLELGAAGPDAAARAAAVAGALDAAAALPETDPTLGGAAERLELAEADADDLPPNGEQHLITFTLRVRSADRLGRTA